MKTKYTTLDSVDRQAIRHALEVAARTYRDDALVMRDAQGGNQFITPEAAKQLSEQFRHQEKEAWEVLAKIDAAEGLAFVNDED